MGIDAIGNLQITWVESRKKFVYDEIFDSPGTSKNIVSKKILTPATSQQKFLLSLRLLFPPHSRGSTANNHAKEMLPPPQVSLVLHTFSLWISHFLLTALYPDNLFNKEHPHGALITQGLTQNQKDL